MSDTIVAPASGLSRSSVGIIRVSGSKVRDIAQKLLGQIPKPRVAHYANFENIDKGLALFFPNPHSFTGEDVLELQCHGSPVVIDLLIQKIISLGARFARPGEFSERAFLNNKLDLAQAEAIADLINAGSEQAARAALHSLEGVFSEKVNNINQKIIELRMYVEAALDFPEEEIDFLSDGKVENKLKEISVDLKDILKKAKQGVILQTGMTVVIAGKPNAGKSSLLNLLSGRESAIVTHIPGTTRDILRENIHIDGMPLQIIDTAGLRESNDPVEQEGIKRAKSMIEKADRVLYIQDINDIDQAIMDHPRLSVIYNKIDLVNKDKIATPPSSARNDGSIIYLSAKTGEGIESLKKHLKDCMGFSENSETSFTARSRHIDALNRALDYLEKSDLNAGELLAENLRLSHQSLSEITGEFTTEDLLGKIFSSFCIGK